MYLKLAQADQLCLAGPDNATQGGVGRIFSSLVLQQADESTIQFPADTVYSEGFDGLFGGGPIIASMSNAKDASGDKTVLQIGVLGAGTVDERTFVESRG